MSAPDREDETGSREESERTELNSYLWGYGLSLALTVPVFALVAWSDLSRRNLGWIIGAAALIQIIVHFRAFLHIGLKGQAREDLQLILFAALLLVLMAGGALWIMANLTDRMM